MDAIDQMKTAAREAWSSFTPFEMITSTAAPALIRFAGIQQGMNVLDIGSGTGVVGLSAARRGAKVTCADLSPVLLERAKENAGLMGLSVDFQEADVEALPFKDTQFDVVLSQFGHMFGPRPDVAISEMMRVLKPGGVVAFSTWPPELFTGRMFTLLGEYAPPPPAGASPPVAWGDPAIVRERLAPYASEVRFDRSCMRFPTLSPAHMRIFLEKNIGPITKVVDSLANDSAALATFRAKFEALIFEFFEQNVVRQDFLITRAEKR